MKQYKYTYGGDDRMYYGAPIITIVIDVPETEEFMKILEPPFFEKKTVTLKIGITRKHPKDNFVRRIGREQAEKNAKDVTLRLYKASYKESPEIMSVSLVDDANDSNVYMFTLKKGRKHPHFVNCFVHDY